MNPTDTAPPPPPPPTDAGPRVSPAEMRDLGRLRRARDGRTLGGVCQGLARHLDIDPTVVKVVFVALAFFGGAGVLLYVALWLLVPVEGDANGVIPAGDDFRRILLIVVGVIAVLILLGHGWSDWGPAIPIGVVVIAVVAFVLTRKDRRADPQPAVSDVPAAAERASWVPPYVPPSQKPPKPPKRRGILLFLPALALIAVALGILGIYDADHAVDQAAYPALALAVTGAMLVLGAFWGRAGGLTLIGIVTAVALAATSAVGGFQEGKRQSFDPASSADVASSYDMGTGELVLNLSNLSDVQALNGRSIDITGRAGSVEVIVPRDLRVHVQADIDVAGEIEIGDDRDTGGLGPSSSGTFSGGPDSPVLDLELHIRVGAITVRNDFE